MKIDLEGFMIQLAENGFSFEDLYSVDKDISQNRSVRTSNF